MKLSVKIIGGFFAVSMVALVVGYIGISRIQIISEAGTAMYEMNTKPLENVSNIGINFYRMRNEIKDAYIAKFVLDKNPTGAAEKLKELDKQLSSDFDTFEKTVDTPEERKEIDALKSYLNEFCLARDKFLGFTLEGKKEEASSVLSTRGAKLAKEMDATIQKLFQLQIQQAHEKSQNNNATARSAIILTWIAAGLGTVLAIILGFTLTLSITRPINRVVQGLTEASDQVAVASAQVSGSSQQLAEGASEQAASIEETSSSLEEMASIDQAKCSARQPGKLAHGGSFQGSGKSK